MAWVICLTSASRRTMSGDSAPGGTRAGMAAAACSASSSSRQAASTRGPFVNGDTAKPLLGGEVVRGLVG